MPSDKKMANKRRAIPLLLKNSSMMKVRLMMNMMKNVIQRTMSFYMSTLQKNKGQSSINNLL